MVEPSVWVIEGLLCIPLGLLVWGTQHLLNSMHPSASYRRMHRSAWPVPLRVLLLLLGWVLASLVATGLFVAYQVSIPGWQTWWSLSTFRLAFGGGTLVTVSLVFGSATLGHMRCMHRSTRQSCTEKERAR